MILSDRNWDYNKHFQVEFGVYVQASQVNNPTNTNFPKKTDVIYLCPAPNFKGEHQIMDLRTVQLIDIPKVFKIYITGVVINASEKRRRSRYLIH